MQNLKPTYFFDFESDEIQYLISEFNVDILTATEKTIGLYLKVRDGWRYDPYTLSIQKENYVASGIVKKSTGHCIDKSILLIAGLRGLGIPARIHLAKVKNHIGVERLIEKFGTNELTPHGMVNVFLNNKWLKLSPAFNKSLCDIYDVPALDFDGKSDSFLQAYTSDGSLFMEYLEDYGHYEELPFDFMVQNMKSHYPSIFEKYKDQNMFYL